MASIEYGAWVSSERDFRRGLVRIPEAQVRALLLRFFEEEKDLEKALDRLKAEVEQRLRRS